MAFYNKSGVRLLQINDFLLIAFVHCSKITLRNTQIKAGTFALMKTGIVSNTVLRKYIKNK